MGKKQAGIPPPKARKQFQEMLMVFKQVTEFYGGKHKMKEGVCILSVFQLCFNSKGIY